jgi:dolichol-phosphate mannosyltransferase
VIVAVIPCKNEADNIQSLVAEACIYADHVVVADDASTDATAELAYLAGAEVVSVHPGRRGLGNVYRLGLRSALKLYPSADVFVEMDAGWSHLPCQIWRFTRVLRYSDVAFGYRFGKGASYVSAWRRRALSRFGTALTNHLNDQAWKDATSGFVAYKRHALESLLAQPVLSRGHYYQTEVRLQAKALGLVCEQVPIDYRSSSSSLRAGAIFEAMRLSFYYARRELPTLLLLWVCTLASVAAIVHMLFVFTFWSVLLALAGGAWLRAAVRS